MTDPISLESRMDRLRSVIVELWKAEDIDLHMCDGTTAKNKFGLLRDIREDATALLSALSRPIDPKAEVEAVGVGDERVFRDGFEAGRNYANIRGPKADEAWSRYLAAAPALTPAEKAGAGDGLMPQEWTDRARASAMAFYDSCKRPDLDERAKVSGALTKYQMSLDASRALSTTKPAQGDGE